MPPSVTAHDTKIKSSIKQDNDAFGDFSKQDDPFAEIDNKKDNEIIEDENDGFGDFGQFSEGNANKEKEDNEGFGDCDQRMGFTNGNFDDF